MNKPLDHAAIPIVIIGDAQDIREFILGPSQHNEHVKGWKWSRYIADNAKRYEAVEAELKSMWAERRARLAEVEGV
jgi:hypothetical protein